MDSLSSLGTVDDNDKLPCTSPDCSVDSIGSRQKTHSMTLSITSPSSTEGRTSLFIADETPTPTRFIRNCEEVGLFQDLQQVNPFDEQFRRAAEAVSQASPALSLGSERVTDDVLHTPHVFPHAVEADPMLPPPRISAIRGRSILIPSFSTSECLHLPSPLPTPTPSIVVSAPPALAPPPPPAQSNDREGTASAPPKKRGRKPNPKNESLGKTYSGAICIKPRPPEPVLTVTQADGKSDSLQLLVRLPDGRLVQIPAVPVGSDSGPGSTNATTEISKITTTVPAREQIVTSALELPSKTTAPTISEAKMKLKEVLRKSGAQRSSQSSSSPPRSIYCSGSSDNGTDNDLPPPSVSESNETSFDSAVDSKKRRPSGSDNESEADKRRKYLERNRAAAFRSRQKRKRWINSLEQRTNDMSKANKSLQTEVISLRSEVARLKAMLLAHKDCPVTLAMNKANGIEERTNAAIFVTDVTPTHNQLTANLNNKGNNNAAAARQIILVNAAAPLLALPVVSKALNS